MLPYTNELIKTVLLANIQATLTSICPNLSLLMYIIILTETLMGSYLFGNWRDTRVLNQIVKLLLKLIPLIKGLVHTGVLNILDYND